MSKDSLNLKKGLVNELKTLFSESKSVTVAEYRGITVAKLEDLRKSLRAEEAVLGVYKNSLVEIAVKELNLDLGDLTKGPNAFIFSTKDAVSAPKVLRKFAKTEDKLVIKGGLVEGRLLDADGIKVVATLPPRESLLAMFIGCLQAPLSKFAATVQAVADAKQ
jgi:large subunit ribosomal protein L10